MSIFLYYQWWHGVNYLRLICAVMFCGNLPQSSFTPGSSLWVTCCLVNHICLPVETGQMFTAAVQPPRFHSSVHQWHMTHLWTGQCCRQRSLSLASNPSLCHHPMAHWPHCKGVTMNFEHPAIRHSPMAQEATNSRHSRLHLPRHICR
jgi:hypothetical protein